MATLAERLTEVQTAITTVLAGGQEVSVNGRTIKNPTLESLLKMEAALEKRVARGDTSMRSVAEF